MNKNINSNPIEMAICYYYWCILRMNKYKEKPADGINHWKALSIVNLAMGILYLPILAFALKWFGVFDKFLYIVIAGLILVCQSLVVQQLIDKKFASLEVEYLALDIGDRRGRDFLAICASVVILFWFYFALGILAP